MLIYLNYFGTRVCRRYFMHLLSKIRYAVCAWGGFLTQTQKGVINAFLRRMYKYHFVSECFEYDTILDNMDKSKGVDLTGLLGGIKEDWRSGGRKSPSGVQGLFCETTHNICIKIQ